MGAIVDLGRWLLLRDSKAWVDLDMVRLSSLPSALGSQSPWQAWRGHLLCPSLLWPFSLQLTKPLLYLGGYVHSDRMSMFHHLFEEKVQTNDLSINCYSITLCEIETLFLRPLNCAINCAIMGARLIWKQTIWLVLIRPYCWLANHNPEFRCVICTVLHFLHWC